MKELTIEQKAQRYDEAIKRTKALYDNNQPISGNNVIIDNIFPELKKERENDMMRSMAIKAVYAPEAQSCIKSWGINPDDVIAWLEKQGKQPIYKTPSREIILAIWDLGNEWKELTKGSISTEYGTQLDYIQKHWQESEYYLRAKQSEQKLYGQRAECLYCQFNYAGECKGSCTMKRGEQKLPIEKLSSEIKTVGESLGFTNQEECNRYNQMVTDLIMSDDDNGKQNSACSEEDEKMLNDIIKDLVHPWNEYIPDRIEDEIKWLKNRLKSLRPQSTWKPSEEQMEYLGKTVNEARKYHNSPSNGHNMYDVLNSLYEQLEQL